MTRIGILGGGQLALMTAHAAIRMGVQVAVYAQRADEPALNATPHHFLGQWQHEANMRAFAQSCDVVTLENEFVPPAVLQQIESYGVPVYASSKTLELVQDKFTQKRTMQAGGITVPRFRKVMTATDVLAAVEEFGFPLILKARVGGYDGYGNALIQRAADIQPALEKLQGRELMAEAFVRFVRELAVIVARAQDGDVRIYPVVETIQRNGICHRVLCPAPIDEATAVRALEMAKSAVESIQGVGVFGVELFEVADNEVVFNEIAPRPHNSGHYTIEGTITSQFENHVRAILGLPLGDVYQIAPACAMMNILGEANGPFTVEMLRGALETGGAHVHLYGKAEQRVGRKMGHITVLGYEADGADKVAQLAHSRIRFKV